MEREKRRPEECKRIAEESQRMIDEEGCTIKATAEKFGVSEKLMGYYRSRYLKKEEIPSNLMSEMDKAFNGLEETTVAFFNPHEDAETMNQLTITLSIRAGLKGEERNVAINAAIALDKLIKWIEI